MKSLIAALTVLCLTGCAAIRAPGPPIPADRGRLVLAVVTWNLHGGRGRLRHLISDLTAGRLAPIPVADYLLLVQEATTGAEHDTVAAAASFGLITHFGPVRRSEPVASGNAILSTRPLDDRRIIDLPRERQTRGAVMASVAVAGTRLFVVSAHLENRIGWAQGGLFSDGARARQAEALIRALPESPGIVGGDMNTWLGPNEPAWRALLRRFPDTPPERPQPTFRDRLVLDHLFLDLPDGWTVTRQVVAGRYGSDHHPVLGLLYKTSSSKVKGQSPK